MKWSFPEESAVAQENSRLLGQSLRQDCRIVAARTSALDWRSTAIIRAIITSRREHLKRTAHSASDCPSSVEMTKTKRSKGSNTRIAAKGLLSLPEIGGAFRAMMDVLSAWSGTGMIIWIAHLRTARRLHECAQSAKTPIHSPHSPIAQTRHCSALSWSAVRRNACRYRLRISSLNVAKKSVTVAYRVARSSINCIGYSIRFSIDAEILYTPTRASPRRAKRV